MRGIAVWMSTVFTYNLHTYLSRFEPHWSNKLSHEINIFSANVRASIVANGDYVVKKGRKFIKIGDREISLDIGKPHFKFDKIFGDNEELNEQTNRIINENSQDLIQELKPVVTEIIGQFVVHIVNAIFERFDYDTLFPVWNLLATWCTGGGSW